MNDLTLSIVSHGQGSLVRQLLSDLRAHEINVPIILTLNIPEDEIFLEHCSELSIQIIRNADKKGFGANHNKAIESCNTRFLAVLNPDLRLRENPFPAIMATAAKLPKTAILAPKVLGSDGEPEDSVRSNLSPWSIVRRQILRDRKPILDFTTSAAGGDFRWFAGMFLILRTSAARKLGGFDERYFMYCEDFDLCARAYLSGYELAFVPDAEVVHAAQRESRNSIVPLLRHLRSLWRVWTSYPVWRISLASMIRVN